MSLLPPNATTFERIQAEISGRILVLDTNTIRRQRRADQCDARFLPLLAWEQSVHFWSGDPAQEAGDRASVQNSFNDHLSYGSPAALELEIMRDVGGIVRVLEFWEAGVAWPYFVVEIPIRPPNGDTVFPYPNPTAVYQSAIRRKNVRDMPIVRLTSKSRGAINVAAKTSVQATYRVLPADQTIKFPTAVAVGSALRIFATYKVRPYK